MMLELLSSPDPDKKNEPFFSSPHPMEKSVCPEGGISLVDPVVFLLPGWGDGDCFCSRNGPNRGIIMDL